MSQKVNRRTFVNTTVIGTSAFAIASGQSATSANDKMKLAWVGCGGRGSYLARRALTIDEIEIVSACDLIKEKADRVAMYVKEDQDRTINTYTDFRKMLENENIDGVVCATEVGNHAEVVVPVLQAGYHCLSEKCMEASVEGVDAITRAARDAKGVYQVAFQRRSDIGYRGGVKAIHEGKIGDVTFMQGQWHWGGSGHVYRWVGDVEMSGGKLVEQACHHMDLMSWVMGNIAPTHAVAMGAITVDYDNPHPHQAENMSSVSWYYPNGAIFSYTHLHGISEAFQGEKSWAMGTSGGVDLLNGELYIRDKEPQPVADEQPGWGDSSVRNTLMEFAECCRTNSTPTSNVETARVSTLTALLGHRAMYMWDQNAYGPGIMKWDELGSTT